MTELEIQQEVEKVKKKILENRWFDKPNQINTRILVRFMELSNKNTKPVYIDDLRKICSDIRDFDGNLASMKTEARNNNANGKFFEEYERNTISLWQPVADFICDEYDKWLGGGVIIDSPLPTPTPNTQNMTIPPLNQILYGPPGTGKTYSTIDKALEILRHYELIEKIPKPREDKRAIFDEYRANKQIEFVTFHQSFSYEEFVEGIKPKLIDSSEGAESSEMSYTIKSGIFKEICNRALKDLQEIQERIKSNPCVWKVSLEQTDSELYKYCLKNNEIRIGFQHEGGDKNASVRHFRDEMQKGDIVGIRHDEQSFNAIGVIVGDCDEKNIDKMATITETYPITRKIKWILIDNVKNIQDKKLDRNTVYQLDTTVKDLFAEIQDRVGYTFDDLPNQITCKEPYILIIDEINRGNISKILGELITLIEPSKRIGASEELCVTLPYSNDKFGVPSNLYIIGTMNTADRSIALLDTALRRRFEFVEMMPEYKELQKIWLVENVDDYENSSIDEWNADKAKVLYEILTAINNRIEFLLDREHTIGHAFFFEKAIKEDGYFVLSLDSLKEIFAKKIIPLLQEYFYDDYAKIDAVLNYNKMVESKSMSDLGVALSDDFVDNEKRIYRITDSSAWNVTTFTKIYE